jgi:hypothetical protein
VAKKSRRVKRKGRQVRLSEAQMIQPGIAEATPAATPARPASKVVDLREEYRYVITDLERIGIIAVVMLAALIVLALVLT